MAEVVFEKGRLVLKNFMTIEYYNNLLMDLQLEAKKNLLGDLNKIVNELMENPFSSIKVYDYDLIRELIKILKPYKFTIIYDATYFGCRGYYLIMLKKRGWFD